MVQKGGGFGKRTSAEKPAETPSYTPRSASDKRHEDRESAFKNAKLYIHGGQTIRCAVRNLSDDGCRVSLLGAENLPEEVVIMLDPMHPKRLARVAWRDQNEAGLEFLPDDA